MQKQRTNQALLVLHLEQHGENAAPGRMRPWENVALGAVWKFLQKMWLRDGLGGLGGVSGGSPGGLGRKISQKV